MAQKLAPAEKNSTDISAASAAFCISVLIQCSLFRHVLSGVKDFATFDQIFIPGWNFQQYDCSEVQ